MSQPKGVFNNPQHAEEVDQLMKGNFRQFSLVTVDCSAGGYPQNFGTQNGLVELEGNGLSVMPSILQATVSGKPDSTNPNLEVFSGFAGQQLGKTLPILYVKFNHPDNPWLPIGIPSGIDTNPAAITSYCLTFGRFWLYVQRPAVNLFMYLLVSRGVAFYGTAFGPSLLGAYAPPTWSSLR